MSNRSTKPRRKVSKRPPRIPRNPRPDATYAICKHVDLTGGANIVGSTAAFTAGGYDFLLSDIPSYTELTASFDAYQFQMVTLKFEPMAQPPLAIAAGTASTGIFIGVVDYDDKVVAGYTANDLLQYQNSFTRAPGQSWTTTIVPRSNSVLWNAGAATGVGLSVKKQWIDCASPAVPHYGFKWGIIQASTLLPYRLIAYYHILLRYPR